MSRWGKWEDNLSNFYLEASRGNIVDTITIHKFGLAEDIDTADGEVDIWDGVASDVASEVGTKITPYNWIDDGAVDLQISSSSALDVGVEISGQGLDENWDLDTGSVTLNGQSAVPIGLQRNRIFQAWNSGSTYFQGLVYVSDLGTALVGGVPQDPTKVRAIIHPEAQQTEMALYTVPAKYAMYITHGWANVARENVASGQASIKIYRRSFGGVFRVVHTLAVSVSGNSGDHRPYMIPIRFEAKEDLLYRAVVSANGMGISAGFHGLLIKEE